MTASPLQRLSAEASAWELSCHSANYGDPFIRCEEVNMTRQSLILCAIAAALAACSGGPQQTAALNAPASVASSVRQRIVPAPAVQSVAPRPNHHKSWVSPDVKGLPRLLFISDYGADDVNIFTMPDLKLKGTLTGFDYPEGECTDASGNIWIANTGEAEMLLYSRTGTLLKTLDVPDEYPAGCAVNKANNDLAVANIENSSGEAGNITVFANASGSGTVYTNSSFYLYFFVGYDAKGNLFFDGMNSSRTTSYLAELPAGSSTTQLITLSGATLYVAGFIQWYSTGSYLALGDQECGGASASCVYWVSVSGTTGTVTGTTNLSNYEGGSVCDLAQGVIAANGQRYVAGADYEYCAYTPITANRWPYQAGGTPTNYNDTTSNFVEPLGAAVSAK
jgi:hypothetical protein